MFALGYVHCCCLQTVTLVVNIANLTICTRELIWRFVIFQAFSLHDVEIIHCFNYGYTTLSLIGYQTQHGYDVVSLISRPDFVSGIKHNRFVIT